MSSKKDSHWIPLADLMTVLMVIFLLMETSYMYGGYQKVAWRLKK